MQKQGVIFDFNGTLFWDTKLQNDSWDVFLNKYGFELSDEEKNKYVHGINMKDSFEFLFQREVGDEEVLQLSEEKEMVYREMCLKEGMELAPGAKNLIEFLLNNEIAIGIATASEKNNVEFFIEQFNLLKYFKRERIIYNDGTHRGKPHPDLFNAAIKAINLEPSQVTIFEDSAAGLKAAENAHAGNIIIVNSANTSYNGFSFQQIRHFDEFDRGFF